MSDSRDPSTLVGASGKSRIVGGKYRIDGLLGTGGMGAVYAAVQTSLDRPVALKVLHPSRMNEHTARERFKREAVAIARLKHPNIVNVFDYGVDEDAGLYLVMERVSGHTLHEEIARSTSISVDTAVRMFAQICGAIAAAHAEGILHRDIKPQNILIDEVDGMLVPKVADFGLASLRGVETGEAMALTRQGAILGTPLYMAPEQCDDKPLDERSDVYSLGCVFYEMLTGRPPFSGSSLGALLLKHVNETPTPPSHINVDVRSTLDAVVLRAIEKSPSARFQSAMEIVDSLDLATTETLALETLAVVDAVVPPSLPQSITSFEGRSRLTAEVSSVVRTERLVTLTGPGGIGKSRLAREAVLRVLESFPDGIWWIDLSAIELPGLVPGAVADVLGVRSEMNRPVRDTICERLVTSRSLLVLDGCERVLEACSSFVEAILRRCSSVTVLATSQVALNVGGERVVSVPTLDLPREGGRVSVRQALDSDAVRLFVERVRLQQPMFELNEGNIAIILQLCTRLEGHPLAIELAAARTRVLSVEQLLAKMDDRFRLLTGGVRNRPHRQQTLRAAIDWSYELLSEEERVLFRRLSVFSEGAPLEAVETVCAGEPLDELDVLDLLVRLVDRSLVTVGQGDDVPRYRMLETLRQYAAERLAGSGEESSVRARHFEWCHEIAKLAGTRSRQNGIEVTLSAVESEYGNLRAALGWAIANGRVRDALDLCLSIMPFWEVRGLSGEGRRWFVDALEVSGEVDYSARVRAQHAAGTLSQNLGDYDQARSFYEEAMSIERAADDKPGLAHTLRRLGDVFVRLGRYDEAMACEKESCTLSAEIGDERGRALALSQMAMVAMCLEDHEKCASLYEESLVILRSLGLRMNVAIALHNLAEVRIQLGEHNAGRALLDECLVIARELDYKALVGVSLLLRSALDVEANDREAASEAAREALELAREVDDPLSTATALDTFARIAQIGGDAARSLRLSGMADEIRRKIGSVQPPYERAAWESVIAWATSVLGEREAKRIMDEGRRMTVAAAVDLALG